MLSPRANNSYYRFLLLYIVLFLFTFLHTADNPLKTAEISAAYQIRKKFVKLSFDHTGPYKAGLRSP